MDSQNTNLRNLPSVDRVLRRPQLAPLIARYGLPLVTQVIRGMLEDWREQASPPNTDMDTAFDIDLSARLADLLAPSQRRVLNLTGTVLHTNLGRATLPAESLESMAAAMTGFTNLEYDLARGTRGDRGQSVLQWLVRLTGAEASAVVNNNAAAVLICLNSIAAKREVLVSRGELVEIGGAFRIPDVMKRAGCRLVEVGTTNRTHLQDFEAAAGPRTAAIMKVHTSNFAMEGFTAAVPERELAALAHRNGVPLIVDLGSGTLLDLAQYGLPHEPTPQEMLKAGAGLVTFSGDKLLGGPQAGLIVGRSDLVAKISRNPLMRALRMDKLRLAALEAVLKLYADPQRLQERLPTLRWLTRPLADIQRIALEALKGVKANLGDQVDASTVECHSQIGSGALPIDLLPSAGIALRPRHAKRSLGAAVETLAKAFRNLPVPIIGRVVDQRLVFDLRTLDDTKEFVEQLSHLRR